jgi:DNA-binding PadR family transcriptional regulator
VYPALQLLQDEGLVKEESGGGGRVFALTDAGRTYVKEHPDEVSAPWDTVSESAGDEFFEFLGVLRDLGGTVMQIAGNLQPKQQAAARKVLTEALKELRKILADSGDE